MSDKNIVELGVYGAEDRKMPHRARLVDGQWRIEYIPVGPRRELPKWIDCTWWGDPSSRAAREAAQLLGILPEE